LFETAKVCDIVTVSVTQSIINHIMDNVYKAIVRQGSRVLIIVIS